MDMPSPVSASRLCETEIATISSPISAPAAPALPRKKSFRLSGPTLSFSRAGHGDTKAHGATRPGRQGGQWCRDADPQPRRRPWHLAQIVCSARLVHSGR